MKVPLLDLKAQYRSISHEIEPAVTAVFEEQAFVLGERVAAFEREIADYTGAKYSVGCASGTDALLLALMALDIGPGDEVITTPFTFFATAGSIARTGATPVFCDILPDSYNIDPTRVAAHITDATKAIIPVHLFGLMADMGAVQAAVKDRDIAVIEDAAQAIGSTSPDGSAGSVGDMGCFSFFPSKNLGGAGDGGMITTNDGELAEKLRILRVHGSKPKYYHPIIGINSRLDALQAAVLSAKLRHLDRWSEARRKNAATYTRLIAEKNLGDAVTTPVFPGTHGHIFNQYTIRVHNRDGLRAYLAEHDIGSEVYYPVPLHLQECFEDLGHGAGDFPVSEQAAREVLSLPVYPELTDEMQEYVVDSIAAFYGK